MISFPQAEGVSAILSAEELEHASSVAAKRNESQRGADRADGKVMESSLRADLMGAEGELAVSKALSLPWDGEWLPIEVWDSWKLDGNDVGSLEVRTTDHENGRLILHPNDKDDVPYILVISTHRPQYKLAGWMLARDGKQEKYWRNDVPRPCFMVPQGSLRPMSELAQSRMDAEPSHVSENVAMVLADLSLDDRPTIIRPNWQGFKRFESFDLESHLIQPGLLAPNPVCGSYARYPEYKTEGGNILSRDEAIEKAWELLTADDVVIFGANFAFDAGVLAAWEPALLPYIFRAYKEGRIFDILVSQALDAIAGGHLSKDPRTGGMLSNNGKQTRRYSLNVCVDLTLERQDAKQNDFWRKRYAILERIPMSKWPYEATQYPKDDAVNTLEVGLVHTGIIPPPESTQAVVIRNMADQSAQAETAFAMHLGAMWGIRTNRERVETLAKKVEEAHVEMLKTFTENGFIVPPVDERGEPNPNAGKEDGQAVRRAVAKSYGVSGVCAKCGGTGEAPSQKKVACRGLKLRARFQGCMRESGGCEVCNNTGEVVKYGPLINCKECDSTGFDLKTAESLPRTAGGGISKSRDTLKESGDEMLMLYGNNETEKIRNTYIPFLRSGLDRPINLRPNVLVATGRTSYDGPIQLIPREGGVRECFESRDGYLFCSVDYSALELCSLSQVCLWVVGYSKMAVTINETKDPGLLHTTFAAQMIGVSVEEMTRRVKSKEKTAVGYRQAAKAGNFGFPGGMGAAKLVLSKRNKADGMTEGPDGRLYTGIRFCILIGGQRECGKEKITMYRRREIPPTCRHCIEVVETQLKPAWLTAWPEMKEYFKWVSSMTEAHDGELPAFGPWAEEGGGIETAHRVRGGLSFCDGANTGFQGLAADGAKFALREVTRECYLDHDSPLFGTRPIMFVHDEIFSEMPIEKAHLAGPRKADIMVASMRKYLPGVHVAALPALMKNWWKSADTVYDETGKLIPWYPKEKK